MKSKVISFLAAFSVMIAVSGCSSQPQSASTQSTASSEQKTEASSDIKESVTTVGAPEATEADTEAQDTASGGGTLVVYFSATGTTKAAAETVARVTNADLYEIVPSQIYTADDLNYNDNNSRTTIEQNDGSSRPGISGEISGWSDYSVVYVGYPIWWGDAPHIMFTFAESYDFSGKTCIPFCTSGGSGIGSSGRNIASNAGSGNWLDGTRLRSSGEEEIREWIAGLGL